MSNLKGLKEVELFSQGTFDFQNLRYKTLSTADYEYVKNFEFCCVGYEVLDERR